MAGFGWFVIGIAIGVAHAATLWQTAKLLKPTRVRETLLMVWGGAMLRSVAVASLLLLALKRSLSASLWTLAGFLVARLVYCGVISLSMVGKGAVPAKQEVNNK
ncbi:MAG: hypothetical protein H5T63_09870 [Chloroflexi bacterium]|nr:hypothetical protein [Chloroflexota bacterium]